ncbi:protoporphyrinogen oxidase [Limisphaera sp. VF-2]|jgi:oxygen-dependent protoporphyrinogen oxidase|uniref:protoporphyrinogen oxidase n=1 Tax=Limisphaera sp. VF-2 TaxID=3400418 RepID=UPI0017552CF1
MNAAQTSLGNRPSVAVVGAGITGLTAAFELQRHGVPVTVYEATDRVGGAIRSVRVNGFLAEFGPNTILETSPRITQLVRDAGLAARRLDPDRRAKARYIVRDRRPVALPSSPLGFFTTRLFSWRAKWAVLREPFVPARRDDQEESIADFVRRRLNQEFLDHAIDALVAGIYAGDPERLSVQQAFPKLAALEREYGSLIRGQILGARARKRRGEVAKDRAPKFSFDEGLQVLPDTLRERLGPAVRLQCTVTRLRRAGHRWQVTVRTAEGERVEEHDAVLLAAPAFKLAEIQLDTERADRLTFLGEIRYPPVASVVLGFRREDVAHPCEGFGMLIPRVEGFRILGTIFSSSLFPNRAPAGHVTLTSYVGGERQPELAGRPAEELYEMTCQDLAVLLGVRGRPVFCHHYYWPRAIPQYNLGYGRYRAEMTRLELEHPGLFFAGHYRDGISLGDSILSGLNAAERIRQFCRNLVPVVA